MDLGLNNIDHGDQLQENTNKQENPQNNSDSNNTTGNQPSTVGRDPWANNVTLSDKESPIVVLFGPSSCGKTMTLVRLTRYLCDSYLLTPNKAFRDSTDAEHHAACENFNAAVSSDEAADGTAYVDYLLLNMQDKGHHRKTICQLVESPGEFLFALDPIHIQQGWRQRLPAYMNTIVNSKNRKIWVFFLESSLSNSDKSAFVQRIKRLTFGEKDRFVFLVNKIDLEVTSHCITSRTNIHEPSVRTYIKQNFPGLLSDPLFIRQGFWGDKELFKVIGFMTGNYTEGKDQDGRSYKTFQAGDNSHPKRLWAAIKGAIDRDW